MELMFVVVRGGWCERLAEGAWVSEFKGEGDGSWLRGGEGVC